MNKRPVYLETKLPKGRNPSLENNDYIINRFLKACSKESLLQFLFERSAYTKRFDKPSVLRRQRRIKRRRNAQKANLAQLADILPKRRKRVKKKKQFNKH